MFSWAMRIPRLIAIGLLAGLGFSVAPTAAAHDHAAGKEMAFAAKIWLKSLSPDQRERATYPLTNDERENWHFIPRERKGFPIKEMSPIQRQQALALLNTAMSQKGYLKAITIMTLEQVLHEIERGGRNVRDPEQYFFTVFGEPGDTKAWGWRCEGHHLSLNFLIAEGGHHIFATPSFFGANPAEVREGRFKGLRVLGEEEDLARKLVKSLSPEQRKKAIISETAPRDIITGGDREARQLEPIGLKASAMDEEQTKTLRDLASLYVFRYRPEIAEATVNRLSEAGADRISFAWAGGMEPGNGHYYRIQGPSFLLEYDNTQGDANHIHAVFRDVDNDFGRDWLREHYENVPHPAE